MKITPERLIGYKHGERGLDWADCLVFVGSCAVVYGAGLIFQPAAYIIGGTMMIYLGICLER